jgi:ubiquinone/menaquinone biosynthesis C-methylase UbiE
MLELSKDLEMAKGYALAEFENTYYLGYRDLPLILKKFVRGKKAIDYGCGTGRSTLFLKNLGYEVKGVDISEAMLSLAKEKDPLGEYEKIESGKLSLESESLDLVFSCFVFLTVPTFEELNKIFDDIYRVLKKGGILLFVTSSKYLYIKKYISYDVEPSLDLKSGDEISVHLKDLGVSFKNTLYLEADYHELFKKVGFELIHFEMPLGLEEDQKRWLDEACYSPYAIYTVRK